MNRIFLPKTNCTSNSLTSPSQLTAHASNSGGARGCRNDPDKRFFPSPVAGLVRNIEFLGG